MDIDRESTEVTDSHPVDRNAMEHVDEIAYDPEDPAWIDIDDDQAEQPPAVAQAPLDALADDSGLLGALNDIQTGARGARTDGRSRDLRAEIGEKMAADDKAEKEREASKSKQAEMDVQTKAAAAEKSKRSCPATSPAGSTTDSPTAPNKKSMNAWGKLLPSPSGTPCYLTQIKSLEERIRNTNVTLDNDKQTLLCLGMTLPEKFQYLTKIWFMTPEMTADKARSMLLEEEGRLNLDKNQDDHGLYIAAATRPAERRTPSKKAVENMDCTRCESHHNEKNCWELHPELAPNWLQEKWTIEKKSRKRKRSDDDEAFVPEIY